MKPCQVCTGDAASWEGHDVGCTVRVIEDLKAEVARYKQAALAASTYIEEPTRTNFRREYGLT